MIEAGGTCDLASEPVSRGKGEFQVRDVITAAGCAGEMSRSAVVLEVDEEKEQCLVEFDDGSTLWADWSTLSYDTFSDIVCCECSSGVSQPPDYIVICDGCGKGYHQYCHDPYVGDALIDSDQPWHCITCSKQEAAGSISPKRSLPPVPLASSTDSGAPSANGLCLQFPYQLESLHWEDGHRSNVEATYCYCGKDGIWYKKMIQCIICLQWFHEGCLQSAVQPMELLGCRFKTMTCSVCTQSVELHHRYALQWIDVALLIFFNLMSKEERRRQWIDFWDDIIPFLDRKWHCFSWGSKDYSETEKSLSLLNAMLSRGDLFLNGRNHTKRMTLFRFHDRTVPAPQPDTKLPHHSSPIPYPESELPTVDILFRFSLESTEFRRRKKCSRTLPPHLSAEFGSADKNAGHAGSASSSSFGGDGSPDLKRTFSISLKSTSSAGATTSVSRGGAAEDTAATTSIISPSGKLLHLPQGCARKTGEGAPNAKSNASYATASKSISPKSSASYATARKSMSSLASDEKPIKREKATASRDKHAARSRNPSVAVSSLEPPSPGTASSDGRSIEPIRDSHLLAPVAKTTTGSKQSRVLATQPRSEAKSLRPSPGYGDWVLRGQPLPYTVLGTRTLPSGEKQYLLDWH